MVGPSGLEPPTLRLSVVRSSQLSYGPIFPGYRCTLKIEQCKRLNFLSKKRSDLGSYVRLVASRILLRKEVIQPLVLERLPCYDFTPITKPTFGRVPLAVRLRTSGVPSSHGVTGGVYKARERIHRGMLIRDY